MSPSIVPIVEGHSEQEAVPALLRRIGEELGIHAVGVARPFRVKRNRVVREGELERAVEQAVRDREDPACVLVILDADDDCPAELAPRLFQRCQEATNLPSAVVLANREFEAWFLGAKESLRGLRGIPLDAASVPDPERIRGAKERLSHNMPGRGYVPSDDQAALAARMDLRLAADRCPSFEKLLRDVGRLFEAALRAHE